jgi:hypothetical protein
VAEYGSITADKNRGHLFGHRSRHWVPDQVDPSMHGVKPLPRDAVFNRSAAYAGRKQLSACNDTVLSGGHTRDGVIAAHPVWRTALDCDPEDRGCSSPR